MSVENIASLAVVTAAALYVVAMMVHATEWLLGSERSQPTIVEQADQTPSPNSLDDQSIAVAGAGLASEAQLRIRLRIEQCGRIGVALSMVGFLCHLLGFAARGIAAHRLPWGNMYEFTSAAVLFLVGGYLFALWRWQVRWLGVLVMLIAAVALGLAVTVFYVEIGPLVPALRSVWFIIHIIAAVISCAAFNLSALLAVLYLWRLRAESHGTVSGYLARTPAAARLDDLSFKLAAFAFPIWTFTIAAGAIWAQYAWGRYWGWDPKETWSLVTWVVYAGYLHARLTTGWRGKKAAIIAIIGAASFWWNFVGVNLFITGLHSYAK